MTSPPPLTGLRVLELAGLAPGPFAGMLLADFGASVLRIDRPANPSQQSDLLTRRKTSIAVDLKSPSGVALIKKLVAHVDIIIDPFRPGVMEKLGLGPDDLKAINERLVFGRMTGFRRDGKYKDMAGHDINYIAVSGVLSIFGRKGEKPYPPVNVLGDFAGGGAMLFQGLLLALLARERSGKGQVVEANMVDGSAYTATFPRFGRKTPLGNKPRGCNTLDGGSPWYETYETSDGKFMAIGAIEPQFFAALLKGLGLEGRGIEKSRMDPKTWPELVELFTKTLKSKTRAEWEEIFDGTDACVTPVLDMEELEVDASKEGDQRPPVTLTETPGLAIKTGHPERAASLGQGKGVKGDGHSGTTLRPGEGGEETLNQWLGWKKGREFEIQDGGLVAKASSKI